jgi:poly(ADP-ribose) glycohydrolase ARH3
VEHTGISYPEAAGRLFGGEGSYGNGAAMRVAPVGLFFRDSPDLYDLAAASAAVTHAHPLAQDGAAVQAFAVAQAVSTDPREPFSPQAFLEAIFTVARTREFQEKLCLVRSLLSRRAPGREAARALGQSVRIHESLPFALYAFLAQPQSFEDCICGAVLSGGDRDTLGAMAGALSGAYLGIGALPPPWLRKLEHRDLIERLAGSLLP